MNEKINKLIKFYQGIEFKYKDIALVAILSVVFLILDFSIIMGNQFKLLNSLNKKIKEYKDKSTLIKDFGKKMESFNSRRDNLKSKSEQLSKGIVSEEDVAYLIENISVLAIKEFVKISEIKPQLDIKPTSALNTQDYKFSPLKIEIEASSGYHQLGRFLNKLENENPFISVKEFSIKQEPNNNSRHNIRLVLMTFIKIPTK